MPSRTVTSETPLEFIEECSSLIIKCFLNEKDAVLKVYKSKLRTTIVA